MTEDYMYISLEFLPKVAISPSPLETLIANQAALFYLENF